MATVIFKKRHMGHTVGSRVECNNGIAETWERRGLVDVIEPKGGFLNSVDYVGIRPPQLRRKVEEEQNEDEQGEDIASDSAGEEVKETKPRRGRKPKAE